jgi:hypothetical protein
MTKYKGKQETLIDVQTNKMAQPPHIRVYININIIEFQPSKGM